MRAAMIVLLFLIAGCRQSPPTDLPADADAYFQAKERYDKALRDGTMPGAQELKAALADLQSRARAIVKPVSIDGRAPTFNLDFLPSADPEGMLLDGFGVADSASRTTTIVTTRELLRGWLRSHGDSAGDPLVNVAHENRLTWVFWGNAHVSPFADIRAKAKVPDDVFLALLVGRSNDVAREADEVIIGVWRDNRVYLMIAPAEARITAPASCGSPLTDAPHRKCFDVHAAAHPDFPKIVKQVHAMRARLP